MEYKMSGKYWKIREGKRGAERTNNKSLEKEDRGIRGSNKGNEEGMKKMQEILDAERREREREEFIKK